MKNGKVIQSPARRIALIMGMVMIFATSVHAQDLSLSVHIPFAFHAGDLVFPAGDYAFRAIEVIRSTNVLRVESLDTKNAAETITKSNNSDRYGLPPQLVFNPYGEECFLTTIEWGYGTANELSKPRHGRESTRAHSVRIVATVAK
jgi:hypothetical protein